MEGYSKSEKYSEFKEEEDEDEWDPKSKVKYTLLKEEDFIDDESSSTDLSVNPTDDTVTDTR